MRVLTEADVELLLPPPAAAVRMVHEALVALADGAADVPPKPTVHLRGKGFANAMPAAMPSRNLLGCKWISIAPSNADLGQPTATGLVVVNDATTGSPTCVMPAAALTAARTAAVSGPAWPHSPRRGLLWQWSEQACRPGRTCGSSRRSGTAT
jgi:ornithine cyclodeaminase/alanine dehydrogenase